MLKRDLVEQLSQKQGITKVKSREIIDDFLNLVEEGLSKDKIVKITGFGTLEAVERKARKAKNPQTGKVMNIETGYRVRFKVSKQLKEVVEDSAT